MPNILSDSDVKWALAHLDRFGDTDLFPSPFELTVMLAEQRMVIDHVRGIDLAQHKWQEPRRALVLKDELAFRNASQLEPLDAVIFAAVIRHLAKKLEARRGDKERARVFSYRAHPLADGQLYVDDRYKEFWTESRRLATTHPFVLVTDLTDFYNQVYHHTVEQELQAAGVDAAALSALKHLLQRSSVTVSRGIPIGPHGAHLLAELSLRNIDDLLVNRGVQYVRFVDDFHIFCSSKEQAHRVLYELAHALDLAKLHLNVDFARVRECWPVRRGRRSGGSVWVTFLVRGHTSPFPPAAHVADAVTRTGAGEARRAGGADSSTGRCAAAGLECREGRGGSSSHASFEDGATEYGSRSVAEDCARAA